jgi:hypothetical protein
MERSRAGQGRCLRRGSWPWLAYRRRWGHGHLGLQYGAIAYDVKGDGFKSKVMAEGTLSHRFGQPGTYEYM